MFKINFPTYLTLFRIFSPFLLLFFVLFFEEKISNVLILIVFALASFTDYLDGIIARKYNLVSKLGTILDPIADKILSSITLIILLSIGTAPIIPVVIIIFREFFISGLRESLSSYQLNSLKVTMLSKIKTFLQFISIIILCGYEVFFNFTGVSFYIVGLVLIWITSMLTLYTGIVYCYMAYKEIKDR